ncbi:RHS repeat protein [Micromonospora sp. PPF5-17]|uniref:RHS repeat protein n=1 Tax=Micromonospora solifontis TaxID=2487138 RepID=A0ABX9WDV0_9ACTN|nr:RHS repeat protein [Micromonospora sp. PPF5-17B]NES37739.1 RHS repeat protein [Micromonospora solifontis]NES58879.1 RHS repeat protein [Micromonospora sp. PPF5-6]RNL98002.1 RHS repeat protein [Micromonospora solifontis]
MLGVRNPYRRGTAAALVAVLVAGLLQPAPSQAAPAGFQRPAAKPVPSIPVKAVKPATTSGPKLPPQASAKPAPVWPAPGRAVVDLATARLASGAVRAGALPVRISRSSAGAVRSPDQIQVEVLDRAATARAGVDGVLLKVGRTGLAARTGRVAVSVDYGSFATAYGADWSSRLRLVSLPQCALTTPGRKECVRTPLSSRNDLRGKSVTASVPLVAAPTLLAVEAAPSGPAGDYSATSLQPSSTWSAGGSSGAFNWSYPMRVPPATGGPAPEFQLSYSSQSVDGRHAASNNQPSWMGEGFDAWPGGFVERRYKPCSRDMDGSANNDTKTGDECWETDNATLSLNGTSGELLYNATEGRWHLRNDEGARIERRTGAGNGDDNGEYWVVTTTDGIQYWFGLNHLPGWVSGKAETNSTWTVPVFGNDPGEPCHAASFAGSDCVQAWRWNLDYVVDLHGNTASYWYAKETNRYGRNLDPDDAASYVRGGWLDRIDYGTRQVSGADSVFSSAAPFRVELTEADRCLSSCDTHDEAHWPDTPWDSACTGSSCPGDFSPTYWTTKRLASVTTQVRSGTGYRDVERWTFTHSFPDPGDGTRAGLWLDKISHVGLVGGSATMPDVEFTPVQLANRVDTIDFAAAMNWMRITKIRNETGGTISVNYSDPDCKAGETMPTPHTNTRLCYPVIWEPEGYSNPVTDWFQKYVVKTIYENDNTGGVPPQGSPRVVYKYDYYGGAAWHYADDDGLIEAKYKTWSSYRGYGRVSVTVGDPGEQTYSETRYFRGMHGDKASPTGGTRNVTIDSINDEDWYAGTVREEKTLNGPGGPVVSRQTNDPWPSPATATRTINGDTVTARFNRIGTTRSYTTLDAGRGERVTKTVNTFDSYGMAIQVDDLGEEAVAGDEKCTKSEYNPRNIGSWILDRVHSAKVFAVKCADTGTTLSDDDVITETRTSYDSQAFGTAPSRGMPTRVEKMASWNAGAPTFVTQNRAAYDAQGRVTSHWDGMNYETKTAYTPATGGPVTAVTVTNPMQHVAVTNLEPAWGATASTVDANNKRTDLAYDPLGRLTAVWLPDRDKATETPNLKYTYLLRADAPSVVSSARLNAAGNYQESFALFDGLLRERQSQVPSPSGGRLLTDAFYDTAGRKAVSYGTYHATGTAGGTLSTAIDRALVPNQSRTVYDGAGRVTATIFQPYDAERWRTSTYYGGDRVDVTAPEGSPAASSTLTDARDQTVELRQYHGSTPTPFTAGSYDATRFTIDRRGNLTKVTDSSNNQWTYVYDGLGRKVESQDPDRGKTTFTYDNNDRVTTSTDVRNKKLAYLYDSLNRKRAIYDNQVGGTLRAQWVYDTLVKGQLTQTTRMVGSAPYQVKVIGYTENYAPTGAQVIIPASEVGLAGTYNFETTYNVDGSVASNGLPSTNGDLPAETLTYGYDAFGGLKTVNSLYGNIPLSYVADTDYNALGQIEQMELYTGSGGRVFQSYTRELETGRLLGIRTDRDSVAPYVLGDVRYSYNQAGNITKIQDVAPDPVDDTQCFTYDHLGRLTEAWTPGAGDCTATRTAGGLGGPAPYWHSWQYDKAGNRTKETVHGATSDAVTNYVYPTPGSPKPHTLSSTTGARVGSYTYDEMGNTLTRPTSGAGTQTLTWDEEAYLATSTDSTGQTSYVYDADGNRLIRRDPQGKTLYLPGQEIRYRNSSQSTATTRYYQHNGSVVASRTAAGLTWLAGDHQGTAYISVDQANQSFSVRRRNPFGAVRGVAPAWPNTQGFVGGTDDNTGLTHLGAREYDQSTGRFISSDPIMDLTDPQQMHGYTYAHGNPVAYADPSGLIECGNDDCSMNSRPTSDGGEIITMPDGSKEKVGGKGSGGGGYKPPPTALCSKDPTAWKGCGPSTPNAGIILGGSIVVAPTEAELQAAINDEVKKWCDGGHGWGDRLVFGAGVDGCAPGVGGSEIVENWVRGEICADHPDWCEYQDLSQTMLIQAAAGIGYGAFGKTSKRPPHTAVVSYYDANGKLIFTRTLRSGNATPAEAALPFPLNSLATHTERRAVVSPYISEGGFIVIEGQYSPCSHCRGAMRQTAENRNVTIVYRWQGRVWVATPEASGWNYRRLIAKITKPK